MSRLSIRNTSDGLTVEISPSPWSKPIATLLLLSFTIPSWAFIATLDSRPLIGHLTALSPHAVAAQFLSDATVSFAVITIVATIVGGLLIHTYTARETLSLSRSQLSIHRKANRWTKAQNIHLPLGDIENVHLSHVGRGFPPAVAFTYRENKYYVAKRLCQADTIRVVELLNGAVEIAKKQLQTRLEGSLG